MYKESWKYLKHIKRYLLIAVLLFFLSSIIGFIYPTIFSDYILNFFQELLDKTKDMNFYELLFFILRNNIQASFFSIIFGLILFPPITIAVSNGYILGFVSNLTVGEAGYLSLLRLLPHGIFELPALFLSLACGLKISSYIFQKNKKVYLKKNLKSSLKLFLFVILPLLIIAGIIETSLIFYLR